LLPDYGGDPITWTVIVDAAGVLLPYYLPAGYVVSVAPHTGKWLMAETDQLVVTDSTGSTVETPGGLNLGRMVAQQKVIRLSDGVEVSEGSWQECLSSDVTITNDDTAVLLGANIYGTAYVVNGYILADVTITPPATTVGITYDNGTGPATATIGEPFVVYPQVTVAGGVPQGFVYLHFSSGVVMKWTSGNTTNNAAIHEADFSWRYPTDADYTHLYYVGDAATVVNPHIGTQDTAIAMSSFGGPDTGPFELTITGFA
jgi:hypothetical protein